MGNWISILYIVLWIIVEDFSGYLNHLFHFLYCYLSIHQCCHKRDANQHLADKVTYKFVMCLNVWFSRWLKSSRGIDTGGLSAIFFPLADIALSHWYKKNLTSFPWWNVLVFPRWIKSNFFLYHVPCKLELLHCKDRRCSDKGNNFSIFISMGVAPSQIKIG